MFTTVLIEQTKYAILKPFKHFSLTTKISELFKHLKIKILRRKAIGLVKRTVLNNQAKSIALIASIAKETIN